MTPDELNERVERTLKRNRIAIKQAESRTRRLNRAAERSSQVMERAIRRLRQGAASAG